MKSRIAAAHWHVAHVLSWLPVLCVAIGKPYFLDLASQPVEETIDLEELDKHNCVIKAEYDPKLNELAEQLGDVSTSCHSHVKDGAKGGLFRLVGSLMLSIGRLGALSTWSLTRSCTLRITRPMGTALGCLKL